MNKEINYKLVDTAGQITAVVISAVKRSRQSFMAQKLMNGEKTVEQVVFLEKDRGRYRLQMMGNELSINGSLAGAYLLSQITKRKKFYIEISGLNLPVKTASGAKNITANFPISILRKTENNVVLLSGMAYILEPLPEKEGDIMQEIKKTLSDTTKSYKVPAAGIIFYKESTIKPLVYVKDTDSLVCENACGSGSLAYFVAFGYSKIKQPSGSYITISKTTKFFAIKSSAGIIK